MNKSYKSIWNETLGTYVAAAETAVSSGRKTSSRRRARRVPARDGGGLLALEPRIVFDAAIAATAMDVHSDASVLNHQDAIDQVELTSAEDSAGVAPADADTEPSLEDGKSGTSTLQDQESGAAGAVADDEPSYPAPEAGDSSAGTDSSASNDAEVSEPETSAVESTEPIAEPERQEIIFVDSVAADATGHLTWHPGEVYILDAHRDGIEQMAEILSGRIGIDAIHIISHGSAGRLQLGAGELTVNTMAGAYADEMMAIRGALSEDADVLLYGCDVGAESSGSEFVAALADATGAEVLASTDDTGAEALGGDWVLEISSGGEVQTEVISAADWAGLMTTAVNTGGGAILAVTGKTIYSVDVATGKATLLTTVPATIRDTVTNTDVSTGSLQNSLAVNQADGLIYYAGENNALFAYDYNNNVHIVVDADVRDNGITTSARGLASGGGVFANGTLYLGVENNGSTTTTDDTIYRVTFSNGGRTISGVTVLVANLGSSATDGVTGNWEWGDLGFDPGTNTLVSVGVRLDTNNNVLGYSEVRYNALTGVVVQGQRALSGNSGALQVSTNQLSQTYLVGGGHHHAASVCL